jgi:hypothetical protein
MVQVVFFLLRIIDSEFLNSKLQKFDDNNSKNYSNLKYYII